MLSLSAKITFNGILKGRFYSESNATSSACSHQFGCCHMLFFVRQKVQISSKSLPQIPNFASLVKFRQKSIFSSRRPVFVISSVFRYEILWSLFMPRYILAMHSRPWWNVILLVHLSYNTALQYEFALTCTGCKNLHYYRLGILSPELFFKRGFRGQRWVRHRKLACK